MLHSLIASLLVVCLVELFFNSLKNVQYFFTIFIYLDYMGHEKNVLKPNHPVNLIRQDYDLK